MLFPNKIFKKIQNSQSFFKCKSARTLGEKNEKGGKEGS